LLEPVPAVVVEFELKMLLVPTIENTEDDAFTEIPNELVATRSYVPFAFPNKTCPNVGAVEVPVPPEPTAIVPVIHCEEYVLGIVGILTFAGTEYEPPE